jgi:hypothetical protein
MSALFGKCYYCGMSPAPWRTDPFLTEIYDDYEKKFLCDNCAADRKDEI